MLAGEDATPRVVAVDVVEQQCRRRGTLVVELGGCSDLKVPAGPFDVADLAHVAGQRQPAPQVIDVVQ